MDRRESLTNEAVSKKFINQFDMVNYAIDLTVELIKSGRTPRVHADSDNPAVIVIEEMQQGKDHLEKLPPPSQAIQELKETIVEETFKAQASKQVERKRARRLMA